MPQYHAYTEYHDSILSWNGYAESASDAAAKAAEANNLAGDWTVIAGTAVDVKVIAETRYVPSASGSWKPPPADASAQNSGAAPDESRAALREGQRRPPHEIRPSFSADTIAFPRPQP